MFLSNSSESLVSLDYSNPFKFVNEIENSQREIKPYVSQFVH